MGLTSALNTSLNGLALNETTIDVLGNNIANAGTNGFKASSVRFATQLSRTLSVGTRPTAGFGGTNPLQVGLGATVSVISRDFGQGSISNSTSPSDLAIQGMVSSCLMVRMVGHTPVTEISHSTAAAS